MDTSDHQVENLNAKDKVSFENLYKMILLIDDITSIDAQRYALAFCTNHIASVGKLKHILGKKGVKFLIEDFSMDEFEAEAIYNSLFNPIQQEHPHYQKDQEEGDDKCMDTHDENDIQCDSDNDDIEQPILHHTDSMNKLYTCFICLDIMLGMNKEPCTLSCGHTACKECLSRNFEYNNTCPECRKDISINEQQGITCNILLRETIERLYPELYIEVEKERQELYKLQRIKDDEKKKNDVAMKIEEERLALKRKRIEEEEIAITMMKAEEDRLIAKEKRKEKEIYYKKALNEKKLKSEEKRKKKALALLLEKEEVVGSSASNARTKLLRWDGDIRVAVTTWCYHKEEAIEKYGHISDWDTSCCTINGKFIS
jgi:hypothetical protein